MKQNINIENLVEKFNHGNISHEELAVLVEYLKANDPGNELLSLYQKSWDMALLVNNETSISETYSSILKKIEVSPEAFKTQGKSTAEPRKLIRYFWKYAAVFAIAFSMSWLTHNLLNNDLDKVSYQNIEVPYGSKTKIELPDGSRVSLNSGSKLKYEKGFGDKTRVIFLEGEAFFDVKKTGIPFYVHVSGIKIKVLGTTFNVKAYPEEKTVETTLITGRVEIFKSDNADEKIPLATLTPNQKAVYQKKKGEMVMQEQTAETKAIEPLNAKAIKVEENVKTDLSTAWKDNEFVFDNERFEDLVKKVERWYDVEIELNYPGLNDARFSGKFDKETIEQAIKALTFVTPFQYTIEKNKILIYK